MNFICNLKDKFIQKERNNSENISPHKIPFVVSFTVFPICD